MDDCYEIFPDAGRILIADDNSALLQIISNSVKREGYEAVKAKDGAEAFRILRADANFVAAILDIEMPRLSGIDIVNYMQTEKRLMRIPVILMTSHQNPKAHSTSLSPGATIFLPKPFTTDQLRLMLRMLERNKETILRRSAA